MKAAPVFGDAVNFPTRFPPAPRVRAGVQLCPSDPVQLPLSRPTAHSWDCNWDPSFLPSLAPAAATASGVQTWMRLWQHLDITPSVFSRVAARLFTGVQTC